MFKLKKTNSYMTGEMMKCLLKISVLTMFRLGGSVIKN